MAEDGVAILTLPGEFAVKQGSVNASGSSHLSFQFRGAHRTHVCSFAGQAAFKLRS